LNFLLYDPQNYFYMTHRTTFGYGITVTDSSITFPVKGLIFSTSVTIYRNQVTSFVYLYDNWFQFLFWRFIAGPLWMINPFFWYGIPLAIKILRGDVMVRLFYLEGTKETSIDFWLRREERDSFRMAMM